MHLGTQQGNAMVLCQGDPYWWEAAASVPVPMGSKWG